jgi:molecular chaperone GrpE
MTQSPVNPNSEPEETQGPDLTVDLSMEGLEDLDDLQAAADAVAETYVPPSDDVSSYLNAELESTLNEALERIKELEKHESEQMDKHHRLLADFSNYRNRTGREIQMAVDQSEKKLLREVLPVLDNFDRCLSANYQSVEDFRNGIDLIRKQFVDALKRLGVEPVALAVGDPFDAQQSEALTTMVNPELPDGAVAAIYECGFMLRDQLLRPARVVVNRSE